VCLLAYYVFKVQPYGDIRLNDQTPKDVLAVGRCLRLKTSFPPKKFQQVGRFGTATCGVYDQVLSLILSKEGFAFIRQML
jgi:hypothetical protein